VEYLFLAANKLGDDGVKEIAKGLPAALRIDWLSLSKTEIGFGLHSCSLFVFTNL
jgi:hypothetical protein